MKQPFRLRQLLRPPLLLAAFVWVVLEETLWRWATALSRAVAGLPVFAALERLVLRLDPRVVVVLFAVPALGLIPVKLAAVWLIGTGHVLTGIAVLFAAKAVGTAFAAHLYAIAEPRLMTLPLFVRCRTLVLGLVARAHAFLDASATWQRARAAARRLRQAGHQALLRARALVFGSGPSVLSRVRALRRHWSSRA